MANFRILICKKIVGYDPSPVGYELGNLDHSLTIVKASEGTPLSTRDTGIQRSWFCVGQKYDEYSPIFRW